MNHPYLFRRWLSTASIVYYHCLNITLVASFDVAWPPSVVSLARHLSIEEILSIPSAECAASEGLGVILPLIIAWSHALVVLLMLLLPFVGIVASREEKTRDMLVRYLCLLSIFTFLSMSRVTDKLGVLASVNEGARFVASLICAMTVPIVQLLVALYLRRHVNAYDKGVATGDWSWLPPDQIDNRLLFFIRRFATHAAKWQFAIWLRQLLLFLIGIVQQRMAAA